MNTDLFSAQMSSGEQYIKIMFDQESMDGPYLFFSAPNEEIFKLICSLLQMRIDEINKLNRRFRDCNRFEFTDIVLNQHC